MIALYLASFGLLSKPALYLSDYFERYKTEYVDNLMAVRESDHMQQWLIFFLYGVKETAESSIQVFKEIIALKERIEREELPHFTTRRQENAQTLMQYLYRNPAVSISMVADLLGVKANTASMLVNDFVKRGILSELTGKQRNRIFWFEEYFLIFNKQFNNQ